MKSRSVFFLFLACLLQATAAFAQAPYQDLRALSQTQGYQFFWDPLAKNAFVEGSDLKLSFHSGSDYVFHNGHLVRMSMKARYAEGNFYVPEDGAALMGSVARPAVQAVPAVRPAQITRPEIETISTPAHRIRKVVVDAGHGGKDAGASSPHGLQEKKVVLEVARMVKEGLESQGVEVLMTRSADVFIPLSERSHLANKHNTDFFISIHANASESKNLKGFEIYYLSEATDDAALAVERAENSVLKFEPQARVEPTKNLKTILWDMRETENRKESLRAATLVSQDVKRKVSVAAQRVKSANFHVLKRTECPAILVELGYLTNRDDERLLRSVPYRHRIADSIVQGFINYKKEFEANEGYTK